MCGNKSWGGEERQEPQVLVSNNTLAEHTSLVQMEVSRPNSYESKRKIRTSRNKFTTVTLKTVKPRYIITKGRRTQHQKICMIQGYTPT